MAGIISTDRYKWSSLHFQIIMHRQSNTMARGPYRVKYTQTDLEMAIQRVDNREMSKKAAAKAFRIPKTTLLDKLSGRVPMHARSGPDPVLSHAEEDQLVKYTKDMAHVGYPLTRRDLCQEVKTLLDEDSRKTPFRDNLPGNTVPIW